MFKSGYLSKVAISQVGRQRWLQSGPSSCTTTDSNPIGLFRWLPHHSHSVTVPGFVGISVSGMMKLLVKVVGGRVGFYFVEATPLVIHVKFSAPALLVSPITIRLGLTVAIA